MSYIGDIQGAIKSWEAALSNQQRHSNYSEEINVWAYLARAYQQVGQITEAIAQLKLVIAYYHTVVLQKSVLV